jgi:hypothetical protein
MTDQVGMAIEETEVAARTRLVLDANILMRGIPGNQSSLSCLKNTKIPSRSTAPSASCCRDIRSYWKEKAVSHPLLVAKKFQGLCKRRFPGCFGCVWTGHVDEIKRSYSN